MLSLAFRQSASTPQPRSSRPSLQGARFRRRLAFEHLEDRVLLSASVVTVAGIPWSAGYSGDGGQATAAQLNEPQGVAVDKAGSRLFIADSWNSRIRQVDLTTGIITTIAGDGVKSYWGDGGPATAAHISFPHGVAVDAAGRVYIADGDARIRMVDTSGIITTIAGNGAQGYTGDGGEATKASLMSPQNVAVDNAQHLFIADGPDYSPRVRKVDLATGIITTVAGNGTVGYSGDGGPATAAQLSWPWGMTVDTRGNLFIADVGNHTVRKVDATTGVITTVAGTGTAGFSGDGGPATRAQFEQPWGVTVDTGGNLFISDAQNMRVRKVSPSGIVTTVTPKLGMPGGVAMDKWGRLYAAEIGYSTVVGITGVATVAPTVDAISPASGPTAGGTKVTITGENLAKATKVLFGNKPAKITKDTATHIVAISPKGTAGTVDVTVVTPGGRSDTSAADQFTYIAAPIITQLSPARGPLAGGTAVTITGTHLTDAMSVRFGNVPATAIAGNTDTQIIAFSPPRRAGLVDVRIVTAGGTSRISPADKFSYVAAPAVSKITPQTGPAVGGTRVTITGKNLTKATEVLFGTLAAQIVRATARQVVVLSPAGTEGTVDVRVVTAGGTSAITEKGRFTYVLAPAVLDSLAAAPARNSDRRSAPLRLVGGVIDPKLNDAVILALTDEPSRSGRKNRAPFDAAKWVPTALD